jgi:hypothetical protein
MEGSGHNQFNVQSKHLSEGTKENHDNIREGSQYPHCSLNPWLQTRRKSNKQSTVTFGFMFFDILQASLINNVTGHLTYTCKFPHHKKQAMLFFLINCAFTAVVSQGCESCKQQVDRFMHYTIYCPKQTPVKHDTRKDGDWRILDYNTKLSTVT